MTLLWHLDYTELRFTYKEISAEARMLDKEKHMEFWGKALDFGKEIAHKILSILCG